MLFSNLVVAQGQGELLSVDCAQCDPDGVSSYFFDSYWTNDQSQSSGSCEWRCENESITFAKKSFCNPAKPIGGIAKLMKLDNDQNGYVVVGNPQGFNFGGGFTTGPHVFQLDQTEPEGTYRIHITVSYGDDFCGEGFIDPQYCVNGIAEAAPTMTVNGVELSTDPDEPTFFCGSHEDEQYKDPEVLLSGIYGTGEMQIYIGVIQGNTLCNRSVPGFFPFNGANQSAYLIEEASPCYPFTPDSSYPPVNVIQEYRITINWGDNPCNYPSTFTWYHEFEPIDGVIEYDYILPEAVNTACNSGAFEDGTAPADVSVPGPSLGEISMGITTGSVTLQNATMTGYSVFIKTGAGDEIYSSLNNVASVLPYAFSPISHAANPGFVDGNPNFFQLHTGLNPSDCADDPYCTDGVQYFITVEISTAECGSLSRTTPFTICQTCNYCFQAPTPSGNGVQLDLAADEGGQIFTYNGYDQTIAFMPLRMESSTSRAKFVITNVLGQEVVLKGELGLESQSWDLGTIRNGIYVVTVFHEGQTTSEILVK